eukprot:gene11002-biopygen13242
MIGKHAHGYFIRGDEDWVAATVGLFWHEDWRKTGTQVRQMTESERKQFDKQRNSHKARLQLVRRAKNEYEAGKYASVTIPNAYKDTQLSWAARLPKNQKRSANIATLSESLYNYYCEATFDFHGKVPWANLVTQLEQSAAALKQKIAALPPAASDAHTQMDIQSCQRCLMWSLHRVAGVRAA